MGGSAPWGSGFLVLPMGSIEMDSRFRGNDDRGLGNNARKPKGLPARERGNGGWRGGRWRGAGEARRRRAVISASFPVPAPSPVIPAKAGIQKRGAANLEDCKLRHCQAIGSRERSGPQETTRAESTETRVKRQYIRAASPVRRSRGTAIHPPPDLPPVQGGGVQVGPSPCPGGFRWGLLPGRGRGRCGGHREAVQGAGRWASAVGIAGEAPFTLLPPVQGGGPYLNSSPLFRGEAGRGVDRAPAVRCGSSRARPRRSPEPRDSRSGSPCIPAVRAGPFAPRPLPAVRRVARHRPPRPDADGGRRSRRRIHRWEIDAGSGSHPAVAREAASTNDARPTSARRATAWRARVCSWRACVCSWGPPSRPPPCQGGGA